MKEITDGFEEGELEQLVTSLKNTVGIADRKYGIPSKTYKKCFVGKDAVSAMVDSGLVSNRNDAVNLGDMLLNAGFFHHVLKEHTFKDSKLFYQFKEDQDHGKTLKDCQGNPVSWSDFLAPWKSGSIPLKHPEIPELEDG